MVSEIRSTSYSHHLLFLRSLIFFLSEFLKAHLIHLSPLSKFQDIESNDTLKRHSGLHASYWSGIVYFHLKSPACDSCTKHTQQGIKIDDSLKTLPFAAESQMRSLNERDDYTLYSKHRQLLLRSALLITHRNYRHSGRNRTTCM